MRSVLRTSLAVAVWLSAACSRVTVASSSANASGPPSAGVAAQASARLVPAVENRASGAEARGWGLDFTSFEAESDAAAYQGQVVRLTPADAANTGSATPAFEASGRGYLALEHTGDFLELRPRTKVNGLVIRYSIPDARGGGGSQATLGLYVGAGPRRAITLSSRHAWLYGDKPEAVNGQLNQPGPAAHVFWQEIRVLLDTPTLEGIRLQRDASDTAAYYELDVVDAERVAPPLSAPPGALSVAECGARGDGVTLDTKAISECAARARAARRELFFPAGHFLHDARIQLDGLHVRGAGAWHTTLVGVPGAARPVVFGMYLGFSLDGRGALVSDLSLTGSDTSRAQPQIGFVGYGEDWRVERVWLYGLGVGLWVGGHRGVVSESRVRDTYADGININNGQDKFATDIVVEHNHVRGTGDDGIAVLSQGGWPYPVERVRLSGNTVVAPWWGHNMNLGGGVEILAEHNRLADSAWSACLAVEQSAAYPMSALRSATITENTLVRCGGNRASQHRGAIWLFPDVGTIAGLTIAKNRIEQPLFSGIDVWGRGQSELQLSDNTIIEPGENGIVIRSSARGRVALSGNSVLELGLRGRALATEPGNACTVEDQASMPLGRAP